MPMTVTVTIENPRDIVLLSRWASLGRTFDSVERGLELALASVPEDDRTQVALEELQSLHAPLENLHTLIRTEMWRQACGKFLKRQLDIDYNCRLEIGHFGKCQGW